jgi:small conductance mechanosensitive channel
MTRRGHIDRITLSFLQQFASAVIWIVMLILYAHLIPVLRSMGTALLAGASVASVVIGLAAQSTLGNLVAGVSITIYRPFRLAIHYKLRRRVALR